MTKQEVQQLWEQVCDLEADSLPVDKRTDPTLAYDYGFAQARSKVAELIAGMCSEKTTEN